MSGRVFDLATVGGLARTGIAAGLVASAGLVGWRLLAPAKGPTPPPVVEDSPMDVPPPDLRGRALTFPVVGVSPSSLVDTFEAPRGRRVHHAVDIMAPRGTAVVAVDEGRILRLDTRGAGGRSVFLVDAAGRYAYYYAHLDQHAPGLKEGQPVRRGELLGYVGSTGNASANAPHLHFAIYQVESAERAWSGRPVNPVPLWSDIAKRGS